MDNIWQPTLVGASIMARPLKADDFETLYRAASDPLIWQQHPEKDRYKHENFIRFFNSGLDSRGALIVIDQSSGEVLGSSRFYEYDPDQSSVAIGFTFLVRTSWGGLHNGELKKLMLDHAFKYINTVFFHVSDRNTRSMKALLKIGATEVDRKFSVDSEGNPMGTVVFSVC